MSKVDKVQKQPFTDVIRNRCSKKFRKFHMKATVLEPIFNNVAGLQDSKRLQHRGFPRKFAKSLRTSFFFAEHLRWKNMVIEPISKLKRFQDQT